MKYLTIFIILSLLGIVFIIVDIYSENKTVTWMLFSNQTQNDQNVSDSVNTTSESMTSRNHSCRATPYVICNDTSTVSDESKVSRDLYGVALLRRPVWMDTTVFFNFTNCPYSNCYFQGEDLNASTHMVVVEIAYMNDKFRPLMRLPNHLFVAAVWESPHFMGAPFINNRDSYWNSRFNLTATYRSDSDIFSPYAILQYQPIALEQRPNYYDIAKRKTKWVAWFVSNCNAPSKRDQYVQQMKTVIDVDIFGRCGKPCPLKSFDCSDDINEGYRFYLSFENSLCKDYATEKLFKLFQGDKYIVPVVRGGFDYDKFLPQDTFINAAKFKNATNLALYLKELAADPLAYSQILENKDKYRMLPDSGLANIGCQVCKFLNTKIHQGQIQDLKRWMVDDKCYDPKDL